MSDAPIRLGTRRSALATAQSQQVADALAAASGRPVELVLITSEGDVSRASLSELGGRGVFATRLREALLAAGEGPRNAPLQAIPSRLRSRPPVPSTQGVRAPLGRTRESSSAGGGVGPWTRLSA